jgi:hypothetical protein
VIGNSPEILNANRRLFLKLNECFICNQLSVLADQCSVVFDLHGAGWVEDQSFQMGCNKSKVSGEWLQVQ